MKIQFYIILIVFVLINSFCSASEKNHSHDNEEFNTSEFILDHIKDSHEWHLFTKKDGHHVSIPLPVIVYSKYSGFHFFMSSKLAHGNEHNGLKIALEGKNKGKIIELDEDEHIKESLPLDFSITKNIASMMLSMLIMFWLFLSLATTYKKSGIKAPKGFQGFLEPIILFVQDDIAIPNIGEKKYAKFMPYLLTVFFFILLNNLLGLIPTGANVTGNIAVTMTLAFFTLIITNINGSKDYWKHTFATPGVPAWVLPILVPVELIGIFVKPIALTIRLFANITAGHIIILSLVSLIFIFKSIGIAPVSIVFVLFMNMLELLVAILQAYIFTLLSALFIGLAIEEHH